MLKWLKRGRPRAAEDGADNGATARIRHRGRMYAAVAAAGAAALVGTGVSISSATAIPFNLYWLTSSNAPAQLYKDGVPTTWHSSWAIMNTGACNKVPLNAAPAYWFGDFNVFQNAINDGEIAGTTATPNGCKVPYKAVVVDYEDWPATPLVQRQQWKTYVQKAYELAHSHGLFVIQAMTHGVPANSGCPAGWPGYFSCDAPGWEAQYGDAIDVQAQQEETDPQTYDSEVDQAAAEARAANPSVIVLAGLRSSYTDTTTGACVQVPASAIETVFLTVIDAAQGSWLNTNCDPSTFVRLLQHFYGS